jgi:hypothetical protein
MQTCQQMSHGLLSQPTHRHRSTLYSRIQLSSTIVPWTQHSSTSMYGIPVLQYDVRFSNWSTEYCTCTIVRSTTREWLHTFNLPCCSGKSTFESCLTVQAHGQAISVTYIKRMPWRFTYQAHVAKQVLLPGTVPGTRYNCTMYYLYLVLVNKKSIPQEITGFLTSSNCAYILADLSRHLCLPSICASAQQRVWSMDTSNSRTAHSTLY